MLYWGEKGFFSLLCISSSGRRRENEPCQLGDVARGGTVEESAGARRGSSAAASEAVLEKSACFAALAMAAKPMTSCRPASEAAPLPAAPSLSPTSTNPVPSLVTRRFGGLSDKVTPGGKLHSTPARKKKPCLFIWKRYRVVTQLVRNRQILAEILSAEPRGAHPRLVPPRLPDAIPLDSGRRKGSFPAFLPGRCISLRCSPWSLWQPASRVVYVIPRQNPPSLPSASLSAIV